MPIVKFIPVKSCLDCPHVKSERTPGTGYGMDYICGATGKKIAGYVESVEEEPQEGEFPDFCPFMGMWTAP